MPRACAPQHIQQQTHLDLQLLFNCQYLAALGPKHNICWRRSPCLLTGNMQDSVVLPFTATHICIHMRAHSIKHDEPKR